VSGSEDNKIYIWDLQTQQVIQMLEGHAGAFSILTKKNSHVIADAVISISCHPSADILASGSLEKDRSVKLWKMDLAMIQ
jgi:COMPASS component SWD3